MIISKNSLGVPLNLSLYFDFNMLCLLTANPSLVFLLSHFTIISVRPTEFRV